MKILQLIGLHLWIAVFLYAWAGTLWGNYAEKTYVARMRWRRWLMPGRLAEKAYWTRFQEVFVIATLPILLFIYVGALVLILR